MAGNTKCAACGKLCWSDPCGNCRELAERKVRRAAPKKRVTPAAVRQAEERASARIDREVTQEQEVTARKLRFVTELVNNGGHVERACKAAGISRVMMGRYRDDDPEFAAAWESVQETNIERLELEADRRALGYEQITRGADGEVVRSVSQYSDNLLMFRLKALRPEKYRDGPGNKPGTNMSDEELDEALAKMMARRRAKAEPDIDAELPTLG